MVAGHWGEDAGHMWSYIMLAALWEVAAAVNESIIAHFISQEVFCFRPEEPLCGRMD